jgi:hypothetical protein
MLTNDQVAMLVKIAAGIRRNTGAVMNRSTVMRAILAPVFEFANGFIVYGTEREVGQWICRRLKGSVN